MFGSSKKQLNLPGWEKNESGNWIFEITEEERSYVKSVFSLYEEYAAKKEVADMLQNELIASGLSNYADDLIMFNESKKESEERTLNLEKALSALLKATSLSQSPMSIFTTAQVYESLNRKDLAKQAYMDFLKKCGESEKENAPDCIKIAEQKIKEL